MLKIKNKNLKFSACSNSPLPISSNFKGALNVFTDFLQNQNTELAQQAISILEYWIGIFEEFILLNEKQACTTIEEIERLEVLQVSIREEEMFGGEEESEINWRFMQIYYKFLRHLAFFKAVLLKDCKHPEVTKLLNKANEVLKLEPLDNFDEYERWPTFKCAKSEVPDSVPYVLVKGAMIPKLCIL